MTSGHETVSQLASETAIAPSPIEAKNTLRPSAPPVVVGMKPVVVRNTTPIPSFDDMDRQDTPPNLEINRETIAPKLNTVSSQSIEVEGEIVITNIQDTFELMRVVAKEENGPLPSQLDVILAAHETSTPEIEIEAAEIVFAQPVLPAKEEHITLAVTPLAAPANSQFSTVNPQSSAGDKKEPPYSAKHYQNLKRHAHQGRSEIACVAELQLIASRAHIYFDAGSSRLDKRGISSARMIAAKAQSCPEAHIAILGFTDPGGSKEINRKISWNRANSVFHSIKEAGFSIESLEVDSHMEDHPGSCVHYEGVDRRVVFAVSEEGDH